LSDLCALRRGARIYCEITGYSAEELAERRSLDITVAEDIGVTEEMSRKLHREPSPYYFEKRYLRKSGEICWVGCTVSLIRGPDNKPLYILGMVEDISERKKTQSELTLAKEEADRVAEALNPTPKKKRVTKKVAETEAKKTTEAKT